MLATVLADTVPIVSGGVVVSVLEFRRFWRKTRPPGMETSVESEDAQPGLRGGGRRRAWRAVCGRAGRREEEPIKGALTRSPLPMAAFSTEATEQ